MIEIGGKLLRHKLLGYSHRIILISRHFVVVFFGSRQEFVHPQPYINIIVAASMQPLLATT